MNSQAEPRFIGEPITVEYDKPPQRIKSPGCPDRFTWGDQHFLVIRLVKEWRDYQRRGRRARNMQPQHAERARHTGSWGVGRFYFRVETDHQRLFDIYYDRAPRGSDERLGDWRIYREWPLQST